MHWFIKPWISLLARGKLIIITLLDVMYSCNYRRKLAQASSMDDEGRDKDVSFAQKKDQEEVSNTSFRSVHSSVSGYSCPLINDLIN